MHWLGGLGVPSLPERAPQQLPTCPMLPGVPRASVPNFPASLCASDQTKNKKSEHRQWYGDVQNRIAGISCENDGDRAWSQSRLPCNMAVLWTWPCARNGDTAANFEGTHGMTV